MYSELKKVPSLIHHKNYPHLEAAINMKKTSHNLLVRGFLKVYL